LGLSRETDVHGALEDALLAAAILQAYHEELVDELPSPSKSPRVQVVSNRTPVPREIAAPGAKRRVPHFDDLLFLGASMSRYPLEGYREACRTSVVLGDRFASKPIELKIPITIAGMSFGSLSGQAKEALGRGATLAGTSTTTGDGGMTRIESFIVSPFQGVLCLFLLDMGLVAGRGMRGAKGTLGFGALAFGLLMPMIGAAFGLGGALILGLSVGGAALMMTLAASASYIAVPAAMRVALPEANPSVYLTLSLGVTFPFNLVIGIPTYVAIALAVIKG
jgi:hypothetical protein